MKRDAMRKYAILIMNPCHDPEKDRALLTTSDGTEAHILTVRDPEEALAKAVELADAGFGALEVCGAFGEDLARRMYDAAGHRLTVSYVVCPPDQLDAARAFWGY